jgi:hypothetical protein
MKKHDANKEEQKEQEILTETPKQKSPNPMHFQTDEFSAVSGRC